MGTQSQEVTTPLRIRAAAFLVCGVVVALTSTACSVQVVDGSISTAASSPALPASSPPSIGQVPAPPSPSTQYRNYGVSEAFPLPVGVRAFVYQDRKTKRISGAIPVEDLDAAYRFWVQRMPRQGYVLDDTDFLNGFGHIRAHGHGCASPYGDATVRLTFDGGNDVRYTCEY